MIHVDRVVTYSGPPIKTNYRHGTTVTIETGARGVVTDPPGKDGFVGVQFEKGRLRAFVDPALLEPSL